MNMIDAEGTSLGEKGVSTVELVSLDEEKKEETHEEKNGMIGKELRNCFTFFVLSEYSKFSFIYI